MEEGQIARWVINEGDSYGAGDTLAEVDTDKATMEMTALTAGTLLKILKGSGDTAALGETIAITGNKGEDISSLISETQAAPKPEQPATPVTNGVKEQKTQPGPAPQAQTVTSIPDVAPKAASASGNGRLIVSPIAARMAKLVCSSF